MDFKESCDEIITLDYQYKKNPRTIIHENIYISKKGGHIFKLSHRKHINRGRCVCIKRNWTIDGKGLSKRAFYNRLKQV